MVDKRFPEGAFQQDPLNPERLVLNVPSQAAADYLQEQGTIQPLEGYQTGESRRALVDWFAPEKGFKRDSAEKFMGGGSDNMGIGAADLALIGGVADAYDASKYMADQSLQHRLKKRQIEQSLIDKGFNPNSIDFRIEMARQLPREENSGEALFDFALGGVELGVAAKISFKALGNFFKRFNPNASRLPIPEVNVADAVPADTPQFGALAAQQQQLDAVDADFIPFEDIRIDTTQPMNIVENTPEKIPQGEIMYSPSLRAAMNLKQNKGPYEQLKATMLKNGAKPDELEWSGADDFFSGKNVTKQEIVDYLGENDPRLVPNVRRAEGVLGTQAEAMDMREAVDQAMEDQDYMSGAILDEQDLLADYLPDADYQRPDELSDEYLEELADKLNTNVDDLRGKEWVYIDEDGDAEFFQYSEDALADQYGGQRSLRQELEIRVRENLEQEFSYDPPDFMARYRVEVPNPMDAGDTTHSMYFPEGGTDYTENLFQYTDPTGRIKIDQLPKSGHFGDDNPATIFHTRHADYVNEDGDTVRYVGEIQSDPQQNLSSDSSLMSYDQSLVMSELDNLYDDFNVLSRDLSQGRADIFRSMSDLDRGRLGYEANIHDLNKEIKSGNNFVAPSKMEQYQDISEIPLSGELTDLEEELVNEWISNQPRLSTNWSNNNFAQELVYAYLKDKPVDWLSNDIKKGVFDITDDIKNKQEALQLKIKELPDLPDNATEGGPFMASQNKWLDEGLRRSIYDAVKDPDVDYLAFPNDPEAIAKVGGQTADSVKEGTVNYYQRDVQNRLKKLLKAFSKDVSVDEINIGEGGGSNYFFSSKGFKITPEFRKAVMEKGIPTYVVPLAVGTGMGYGALDQVGGGNGQSGS